MSDILNVMTLTLNALKTPLEVYGFSFSFYDIFLFTALGCILAKFVSHVLDL